MSHRLDDLPLEQGHALTASEVRLALSRARARVQVTPSETDWRGLKASERARPLTDLGRRLLGLHVANTTPKEN